MIPCPRCGAEGFVVDGVWAVCGTCGHRAATAYVSELAWLQGQQRILAERLAWVRDRVAAGDPPVPGLPTPAASPTAALTGQQLLLATGGLLLVTAATVFLAVNWEGLGAATQVASVLAAIVGTAAASRALRRSSPATASTLAAVATGILGVALAAAPRLLATDPYTETFDRPAWYAVAGLLTAAASGEAARVTAERGYGRAALVALALASVAEAVWLAEHLSEGGALVVAVLQATLLVLLALRLGSRWWAPASAAVGPGLLATWLLPVTYLEHETPAVVAVLLLGVAAVLVLVRWSEFLPQVTVGVPVAMASAGLGALPGPRPGVVAGIALAAGALAALLARRDVGLAVAAAVPVAFGSLAVVLALGPTLEDTALVWGATAAGLLVAALVRPLRWAAPAAAVSGWLAEVALVEARGWVLEPEQVGLLAALPAFLAAGAWCVATRSALPSLPVWGPVLALLLGPSALASGVAEPVGARTAGVLGVAVLLVILGVQGRLAAPIVVGAAVAAVVAVEQLFTLVELLPRWVSLLVAGAALLAAGLRIERLRAFGAAGRGALTTLR